MKRVYKCEYCYLKNARPCYECSACMSGDDHFRPAKPEKKRTTNADRIRAMSDEELVVFLDEFSGRCLDCAEDAKNKSCPIYKEGRYCRPRHIMEWLQKPAEGE